MTAQPEYYERAPDGKQWPGTLKGLLSALDDTLLESLRSAGEFTLFAIREGHAEPFRYYQHGKEHNA
jgi:hypothetical protein